MNWRRKATGSLVGFIGYMLSPLSWWNDLFVNIPLAIGFGWIIALFYKPAFEGAVIIGYWLTNVLGLVLMQKGAQKVLSDDESRYTKKDFFRDVTLSLAYTALILVLLRLHVIPAFDLSANHQNP